MLVTTIQKENFASHFWCPSTCHVWPHLLFSPVINHSLAFYSNSFFAFLNISTQVYTINLYSLIMPIFDHSFNIFNPQILLFFLTENPFPSYSLPSVKMWFIGPTELFIAWVLQIASSCTRYTCSSILNIGS